MPRSPTPLAWLFILLALESLLQCGNDATGPSCNALSQRAFNEAEASYQSANRACSESADCALSNYAVRCYDTCDGLPVASSTLASLEADLKQVDETYCGATFSQKGCEAVQFPCGGEPRSLLCKDGKCVLDP